MTTVQMPPVPSKGWGFKPLTVNAAAQMKRSIDRGPLRFVGLHVVLWAVFGSLLSGGLHATLAREAFLRQALNAFVPYSLMGLWLGLINWNIKVFGYAKWCAAGGRVLDATPSASFVGHSTAQFAVKARRAGIVLVTLIGALIVWCPMDLAYDRMDTRIEAALKDGTYSEVQTRARWVTASAWLHPLSSSAAIASHHSHVALGLLALQQDDVPAARDHLLDAGRSNGSPTLHTFGPNMALAKALLERGERDVVLAYFDECRTFWFMDDGDLDKWSAEVRAGRSPDFGANLVF